MFSNTIVLDRIVAARAEGGNARAIEEAKTLVEQNFDASGFDVETPVNRVLNALDRFDREAALTAITEALTAVEAFNEEDDEDEDEDGSEESTDEDLATRVARLEKGLAELRQVAVSRGLL